MDLVAARTLALDLMKLHGLDKFTFEYSRSLGTVGQCLRFARHQTLPLNEQPGKIKLSRIYVEQWTEDQVRETVLHEIAHALTPMSLNAHGPEWRATALRIGSNGKRCAEEEDFVDLTKHHKWIIYCDKGHYRTRARRSNRGTSCGKCSKVYNPKYLQKWLPNTPENLAKVEAIKTGAALPINTAPITSESSGKVRYTPQLQTAAKRVTPSRADEFDNGAAFINWD